MKRQIPDDSTSIEVVRVVKILETENKMVVSRSWEEEGMGSCCSMGIEFQFCKMA